MQSLRIAVENPPKAGEYRVFNQFDAAYSVNQLAEIVQRVGRRVRAPTRPSSTRPNPRVEAEQHYYHPIHEHLTRLGYQRTRDLEEVDPGTVPGPDEIQATPRGQGATWSCRRSSGGRATTGPRRPPGPRTTRPIPRSRGLPPRRRRRPRHRPPRRPRTASRRTGCAAS